eukprot:365385-Chlamydomonas_euryale.AAC.2
MPVSCGGGGKVLVRWPGQWYGSSKSLRLPGKFQVTASAQTSSQPLHLPREVYSHCICPEKSKVTASAQRKKSTVTASAQRSPKVTASAQRSLKSLHLPREVYSHCICPEKSKVTASAQNSQRNSDRDKKSSGSSAGETSRLTHGICPAKVCKRPCNLHHATVMNIGGGGRWRIMRPRSSKSMGKHKRQCATSRPPPTAHAAHRGSKTILAARLPYLVHVVQARDLDHPHVVVRVEVVRHHPRSQDVPLHGLAAVDADAQLCVLVLAGLVVGKDLSGVHVWGMTGVGNRGRENEETGMFSGLAAVGKDAPRTMPPRQDQHHPSLPLPKPPNQPSQWQRTAGHSRTAR